MNVFAANKYKKRVYIDMGKGKLALPVKSGLEVTLS